VLAVRQVEDAASLKSYSVVTTDHDGRITAFEEKPEHPESRLAGIAVYFYPRSVLPLVRRYIEEGNNPDQPGRLVQWLYPKLPFYTWQVPGRWYDIGSKETLEQADREFSAQPL
jgi:glucose-1-phosphate thymidylyltransferase